jgi:hypothetical protein
MEAIQNTLLGSFEQYTREFARKFELKVEDALTFSGEYWGAKSTLAVPQQQKESRKRPESSEPATIKVPKPKVMKLNTCPHILKTTGVACGGKCEGTHCTRHMPKPADSVANNTTPTITSMFSRTLQKQEVVPGVLTAASIKKRVEHLKIERNAQGRLVHADTGFIFDDNKKVTGKQLEDGSVADLVDDDIERCKELHVDYILPEKLGGVTIKLEALTVADDMGYEAISDDEN